MKKIVLFITITTLVSYSLLAQIDKKYSDELLSSSFKAYQEVDFEFSYHMYPFIRKRFLEHLNDTSSFNNPYDSLSKYVSIKRTSDKLVKTYAWSVRDTGCCYSTETYVQYETKSGDIKFVDLKKLDDFSEGVEEVFTTDLKMITINNKPYYLILGWGTCCGGKHYSTAKIYEIKNGVLQKSKSMFNGENELYIGANRGSKIELKYYPKQKTLSYNSSGEMNDSGFYSRESVIVKWKLRKSGFKKVR